MNDKEFNICVNNNLTASELENKGELDRAIELYEANVSVGFVGSRPYDRLAIIYHKQQNYTDEIRVIEAYFSTFSTDQLEKELIDSPKIIRFKKRLEIAKDLKEKQ